MGQPLAGGVEVPGKPALTCVSRTCSQRRGWGMPGTARHLNGEASQLQRTQQVPWGGVLGATGDNPVPSSSVLPMPLSVGLAACYSVTVLAVPSVPDGHSPHVCGYGNLVIERCFALCPLQTGLQFILRCSAGSF